MADFPFGISEVDVPILLQLSDDDLADACQSNAYLAALCSDDYFWNLRVNEYYPQAANLRTGYPSWRDLYIALSQSGYIVYTGELAVYNSGQGVQQAIVNFRNRLGPGFQPTMVEVYRAKMGQEFSRGDPEHLIQNLNDLVTYPPRTFVLYSLDDAQTIGSEPLTPRALDKIIQYAEQNRLDEDIITIMQSGTGVPRDFVYNPEQNVFVSNQLPVLVIVDGNLGVLSPEGYYLIDYIESRDDQDRPVIVPSLQSIIENLASFNREPLANVVDYPPQHVL